MKVIAKSGECAGGECPTIYQDDDGTLYVQGFVVPDSVVSKVNIPSGEALVRIDASLFKKITA